MKYHIDQYADDLTLKPNMLIQLIILYYCKYIILIPIVMATMTMGESKWDFLMPSSDLYLLTSIPAVVVMIALIRRRPNANQIIRKIWFDARLFLLAGIVSEWLLCLFFEVTQAQVDVSYQFIFTTIINISAFLYIFSSEYIKDLVLDFPEEINT